MLGKRNSPILLTSHNLSVSICPRSPVSESLPLPILSESEHRVLRDRKVELLRQHSLDLNRVLKAKGQAVSSEVLKVYLFNALTTFEVSREGNIITPIHALRDVTQEELNESNGVEFHNTRSGSSPFSDKHIQCQIRDMTSPFFAPSSFLASHPAFDSLDTTTGSSVISSLGYPSPSSIASLLVSRKYGCLVNLFGLFTDHTDVSTAVYHWLRHLCILKNPVICLHSSKVSFVLQN